MANPYRIIPPISEQHAARFWSKVSIRSEAECWPWLASSDKDGYGWFCMPGSTNLRAPRVAYFLTHGDMPTDKAACHTCDNPPCCNPKHIFAATVIENNADTVRKGRQAKGDRVGVKQHPERYPRGDQHPARRRPDYLPRGSKHWKAQLTEAQVREIRTRRAAGEQGTALAREFGVTPTVICYIHVRKTWRHLD